MALSCWRTALADVTTSETRPHVMPPFGLYELPRNHLYSGKMVRRTYNSNDFIEDGDQPANPDPVPAEKEMKKKVKMRDSLNDGEGAKIKSDIAKAENESKKEKKKKKRMSENGTPEVRRSKKQDKKEERAERNGDGQAHHSAKKRKRDSKGHTEPVKSSRSINEGFVVGQDLSENVMASLGSFDTPTTQPRETAQTTEQPSKKKIKRKSQVNGSGAQHDPAEQVQAGHTENSAQPKVKQHKKNEAAMDQIKTAATQSATRMPKKTPVPLPEVSAQLSTSSPTSKFQGRIIREKPVEPAILVPETPPSKSVQRTKVVTPVPFQQIRKFDSAATERQGSQKVRRPIDFTPVSTGNAETFATAPAASHTTVMLPTVPNALTDANLRSFKEPLSNGNKPRPRTKGGASTATSIPDSSAASMSIQEAFARIGKPYERSAAENDPFITQGGKPKKTRETHDEAPEDVFNEVYLELRKTVNFTEENAYLEDFLEWVLQNNQGPLPCMGNVTGCSSKKEEILRLSREENMTILTHLETDGGDPAALANATLQAERAEDLLMLAVRAKVPVPIGRLEGTWALYCPKYAEAHVDKYGYGKRSLVISSIAGFKHKNSYTARLQLPPRTMSYTLLAFQTPPHASFRATTVTLAAERYQMEIIFLGNGYLQLRVDLRLLLTGKPTDEVAGKKIVMEFIGVHEKATQWFREKDELEEEGRKLFAKYDGGSSDE
ncbi:hypothetical protein N0V90_002944 [Kalmusia sp. IMI 367209]|nr:hypothetical protein N0V90_002944 [Kalmusia sp. IMI 367209]